MKKVVFFTDISRLVDAFEHFNLEGFKNQDVPVKLHMGEMKNKYYPKSEIVKQVIEQLIKREIKPFLFDTTVAYPGLRHSKIGYHKLAKIHGFSKEKIGCDVVIDDTGMKVNVEGRNYEVADHIFNSDYIFAISHVKGHIATGMGGAIKNLGMGGVTKETKRSMHHASRPLFQKDSCTFCGVCSELCPFDAIKTNSKKWNFSKRKCFGCGVCVENCSQQALTNESGNLQHLLAAAAKACVQNKNVLYLNQVINIAKNCDCDPFAGPIICPDIGYLLSDDIVAVDKASLDLVNNVKENIFIETNKVDPMKQINYGEEIGLGSTNYEIIEI